MSWHSPISDPYRRRRRRVLLEREGRELELETSILNRKVEAEAQALELDKKKFQRSMLSDHAFRDRGFRAATEEDPYGGWKVLGKSADEDILDDLPNMRNRSRDNSRNNPIAKGIERRFRENVVGDGIHPTPLVDAEKIGISEDEARAYEDAVADHWHLWDESRPDYTNKRTFSELLEIILIQVFQNGDVFVIPRRDRERLPYSLAVEMIEADRVDTPTNKTSDDTVRGGVKLGPRGEPLAYYIARVHPGDKFGSVLNAKDFELVDRLDAEGEPQVIHVFEQDRVGQNRGVPWLAPAQTTLYDLDQYLTAVLVSAKVNACFAAFIHVDDPEGAGAERRAADDKTKPDEELVPGLVKYLRVGEEVTFAQPQTGGTDVDALVKRYLRLIGAAVNFPYELVSLDWSQVNYTSGRLSLNEARRFFVKLQNWLAANVCKPFYRQLVRELVAKGKVKAPGFSDFEDEYLKALWVGQRWTWTDSSKEVPAALTAIEGNLSTLTLELGHRGIRFKDLIRQRKRERELLAAEGLEPSSSPTNANPPPPPPPPPAEETEEVEPVGAAAAKENDDA